MSGGLWSVLTARHIIRGRVLRKMVGLVPLKEHKRGRIRPCGGEGEGEGESSEHGMVAVALVSRRSTL